MASMIMTHTETAHRVVHAATLAGKAAVLPFTWMKRIRQRRELMGLLSHPDYLIKDVGLQRDEITREGLKPFWFA